MNNKGAAAELLAANYLITQGLEIIVRNYHTRFGEIDLIAKDKSTLVFVEVRSRSTNAFGGAASSITKAKSAKLWKTAQIYLTQFPSLPVCRFDAVLITGQPPQIEWLRHIIEA